MEETESDEQKQKEPEKAETQTEESGDRPPVAPTDVPVPDDDPRGTRELLARERAATHAADVTPPARSDEPGDDLGTYQAMFDQYRFDQKHWLGPAQLPLVFHIAKLCRKLDADPDAPASLSSAYLQALHRLERQRPGAKEPAGTGGDLPGQGSIFDELD